MAANGTTNGMRSWTGNTPGNVSLVSTFDNFHALDVNADLPGVAEEIKTLPEPNALGYDSDNCAILAWGLHRGHILQQRVRMGVGLSRWWSWSECLRVLTQAST